VEEPAPSAPEPSPPTEAASSSSAAADEFWEWWDNFWDEFMAADLEGKKDLFYEVLPSDKMDDEGAFEMLSNIRGALDLEDPAERACYADLVEQLRQQTPDIYQQSIEYYQSNLISDAVADGAWEKMPRLLEPFGEEPGGMLDTFFRVIDQLKYHGRIQLLIQVMEKAWSPLSASSEVFRGAINEFGGELMTLHLFHYLETSDDPHADDPALLEATAPYGDWKEGWLERFISRLTAPQPSEWHPADFGPAMDADQWGENLLDLLMEFVADRHRAGVPYSRGEMARVQLRKALKQQFGASAVPQRDSRKPPSQARGKRRGRRKVAQSPQPGSSLIPRYEVMDEVLMDQLRFLNPYPHKAMATVELLPAYLHFLARVGVIHPTQMDTALGKLNKLSSYMLDILDTYTWDTTAIDALAAAWSDEALTALKEDPALEAAREAPSVKLSPALLPTPRPGALMTYTFKVTYLRDRDVWRTIEIASDQTLHDLHYAILRSVDFGSDHLYSFFMSNRAWDKNTEYAAPRASGPSATDVEIGYLNLRMKQRFLYLFDYGDEHRFEVKLMDVNPDAPDDEDYPRILEHHGENPSQYGW
jgi:hypothetical protein